MFLLLINLGSLTGGISSNELSIGTAKYGWHGIYRSPIYLPVDLIRSVLNAFINHSQFLFRIPSVIFGFLSLVFYSLIVFFWHGKRTAFLATLIFGCSAFFLHISRLATNDILYFWGMLTIILNHILYSKYNDYLSITFLNYFIWGLLLTVPGFIFIVLLDVFWQRELVISSWEQNKEIWFRVICILALIIWLPLIVKYLLNLNDLKIYFGLPSHFSNFAHILKNFIAVPIHLFIRGPEFPELWLSKLPVLDIFSLVMSITGIMFYFQNFKNNRSKWLASLFLLSVILIGLGGAVSFSLIVPLAYLSLSTGIAYLIHVWLKIFPSNPLAKNIGLGIVSLAVVLSCIYNVKSYFVVWRNNEITKQTFSKHV
ncbi:MAG TPA: hypothetical protein VLF63_02870 [Patescibacteria group bacterium]|nr:hypothetical protein [Patescibacteria group bacterium]